MTFSPELSYVIEREYPTFTQWALPRNALFIPKWVFEEDDDKRYDETSKMYLLMRKLNQSYSDIMQMETSLRDKLFDMEMKYMREKEKQLNDNNNEIR